MDKPNVVFVFADQWRAQAVGYAGNPTVKTPHLDRLAQRSINFSHAISGWPVCSPWRATFLTGQYPLSHGVFVNDVPLSNQATSIAQAFKSGGYHTAYIGKWHVDGHGRSSYIPPERRQGFEHWQVLECTHDYNQSPYYEGDSADQQMWPGYDAIEQTQAAQGYIRNHDRANPFFMVLSWGPPHNPYETAPPEFNKMYQADQIPLRPNVPAAMTDDAREWLAGYYAHCSALDRCVSDLLLTLREEGLEENTLFVFTSDHGDMLGSQGLVRKQKPWEESIRVPFLLHYPALFGNEGCTVDALINSPDIMPTLLGLCDVSIPETVEGLDFSGYLKGDSPDPSGGTALLACYHAFGEWPRNGGGPARLTGREFRGLRTHQYTYVRTLDEGPWLLYDNEKDPYQLHNRINDDDYANIQAELDAQLQSKLENLGDEFRPGMDYVQQWGYTVDDTGTVPYSL